LNFAIAIVALIIAVLAKMEKKMREEAVKVEKEKNTAIGKTLWGIQSLVNAKYRNYRHVISLNGYSGRSAVDWREVDHVPFVNHHVFASPGSYHHRYTKQYAFGFQVFHPEFSDIFFCPDFLFLSHWWSNCGGFGLTKPS
jgi:hypothetical protein